MLRIFTNRNIVYQVFFFSAFLRIPYIAYNSFYLIGCNKLYFHYYFLIDNILITELMADATYIALVLTV